KLVDEPSAEDVPVEQPAYNEEEANLQRALELRLKDQVERTQGPARPVVIREPDSRISRFQRYKEKEKRRRTSMPAEASGPAESPFLDAELALNDRETESDDEVPKIHTGDQDKIQAGPNPDIQDEGQGGPNPGVQDEGQAGSNPGDAAGSQPQSSHMVHVGVNLEPMDLEATDASHLQNPEQLDEEFTTKLASSTGTLSSLQNLEKELSFTDQFFVEKKQEEEQGKTNAEAKGILRFSNLYSWYPCGGGGIVVVVMTVEVVADDVGVKSQIVTS
nr:hypothetical protein [Tanacetum cinerariifolium]